MSILTVVKMYFVLNGLKIPIPFQTWALRLTPAAFGGMELWGGDFGAIFKNLIRLRRTSVYEQQPFKFPTP
jgi:hypothetical protein